MTRRNKKKMSTKKHKTRNRRNPLWNGGDDGGDGNVQNLRADVVEKNPRVYQELNRNIKKTVRNPVTNKRKITPKEGAKPKAKPFVGLNCSPTVKGKQVLKESCLTGTVLIQIRNEYNKDHPNQKITTSNYKKLWIELYNRLTECQTESCWLEQINDPSLRDKIKNEIFAPKHPKEWQKNPNEWLSNIDIMKVLKQYEQKYPKFKLLGPSTIDFDLRPSEMGGRCVSNDICNMSLNDLSRQGKTKIAIVFNLDKYTGGGTHWMSAFIDLDEKFVYYFDSAANPIPKEIKVLINRLKKQALGLRPAPIQLKYYTNVPKNHQSSSSECGMYSLFFIITMLTGETEFDQSLTIQEKLNLFSNARIPDKYVEKYRQKYFN